MSNQLIAGIIILAALTILQPSPRFILGDGSSVEESQLPSLGYVLYQGRWYRADYLSQLMKQSRSTADWQSTINSGVELVANGRNVFDEIIRIFGNKGTAAPSTGSDLDAIDAEGD